MVAKAFQGSGLQLPYRLACTKKCHVTVSKPSKTDATNATIGMGNNNKPCPRLGPAMITSIFAAVQSGLCRSLGVKAVIVSQSFILNLSSNQKRRLKATSTSSRSSMLSSFCQILSILDLKSWNGSQCKSHSTETSCSRISSDHLTWQRLPGVLKICQRLTAHLCHHFPRTGLEHKCSRWLAQSKTLTWPAKRVDVWCFPTLGTSKRLKDSSQKKKYICHRCWWFWWFPIFGKKTNRSVAFSIPRIASATHLTILNLCAKRQKRKMVASTSPHITTVQPFEESASRRPSHASWANNYPWPPWTRWLRHSRIQVLKITASWMDWTLCKLNCNSEDAFGVEFATRRITTLKGRRWRLSSWLRASIEPPHPNAKVWPLPKQTSRANQT